MPRIVSQKAYLEHHEKILHELRQQIIDGFSTLDSVKMDALEKAVHYRKKLINFAKSGQQKAYIID